MSFKKIFAIIIAVVMLFSLLPVYAVHSDVIIEFIDITGGYEVGTPALGGEAKILVRAYGLQGDATIAQTSIEFSGNLKYKGIQYLIGENKYPECYLYYPDAAYSNFTKKIIPAVITNSEYTLQFDEEGTDLFILTFYGTPGEGIDVSLDTSDTYYTFGDDEFYPASASEGSAVASSSGIERKSAVIRLAMDKVTTFAQMSGGQYSDSRINLSITDEEDEYTVNTVLNNVLTGDGGHRDGTKIVPTFEVTMDVTSGKRYTVRLSGPGYITYVKDGEAFDTPLELTNENFVPGDINSDGTVDAADKELCTLAKTDSAVSERYLWATDINRDGEVNDNDLLVFADIVDGEDKNDKEEDKEDNEGDNKEEDKDDNKEDGKEDGKEDDAEEDDDKDDNKNSGGSGKGGGGGGSSFSPGAVTPQAPIVSARNFADLTGYEWAEDAIYILKDKGIITGTTASTYSPSDNIKRGDFILILTRMLDMGEEDAESFADVPSDSYYASAISKAKRAGIAKGSGNEFFPENSITRQDLITLAYRAFLNAGFISETADYSSLDQFVDKGSIADYAVAPLASMVAGGIIKGSDGNVNPNGNATRAEVAVMCERLLKLRK